MSGRGPSKATRLRHAAGARALFSGDPLAALSLLGEDEDAGALLLRGIALAQLSELGPARDLLERAVGSFEAARESLSHARAYAALAEVAAAERDPARAERLLAKAARILRDAGDDRNAAWTILVHARFRALLGDRPGAEALLAKVEDLPAAAQDRRVQAASGLLRAELALRDGEIGEAAAIASALARSPANWAPERLAGEIDALLAAMRVPIASIETAGPTVGVDAIELAALFRGGGPPTLVIDRLARRVFWSGERQSSLARRPVLFALLQSLGESWPGAAPWRLLAKDVFGFRAPDDSIRLRVKVEIDRLRAMLPRPASIAACGNAWRLSTPAGARVVRIAPSPGRAGMTGIEALLSAFLADGAAWSSSALAGAVRCSVATVRRGLASLSRGGRIAATGSGRARRYAARDPSGFASQMLLVGLLSGKRE